MNKTTTPNRGTTSKTIHPNAQWRLDQACRRRNICTAATLGLAASGGIFSATWLAATAGCASLAIATLHALQRQGKNNRDHHNPEMLTPEQTQEARLSTHSGP